MEPVYSSFRQATIILFYGVSYASSINTKIHEYLTKSTVAEIVESY